MDASKTTQDTIVCKPTKWFLWRALAMLAMFAVFTVLFLQDGVSGYREKNYQFYMYESFKAAGSSFDEMQEAGSLTAGQWGEYVQGHSLSVPDEALGTLPQEEGLSLVLPSLLSEGYDVLKAEGGKQGVLQLWREFTKSKGWDSEPVDHAYDEGSIREQFIAAGVTGVLILITLFFLIRTLRRSIKVDQKALYSQNGKTVLYTDMVRIDKRKWDNKGMALIYYMQDGEEKKVKIDGMVYGQFNEADGAPAEKLFARVLSNFKGELLQYESEDEVLEESSV